MEKVKISTLPQDAILIVEGSSTIVTVAEVVRDIEEYRNSEIYTTTANHASFDARHVLDTIIENECDNMYEDWDESIKSDIKQEDIDELQKILDRILSRDPSSNIAYYQDKLVEIDV